LDPDILDSAPSSPKRKAAFSLFGPEVGRLPDLRNGDADLGGDDLAGVREGESDSSIQLNEDCAMVERVGTGAFGLTKSPSAVSFVAFNTGSPGLGPEFDGAGCSWFSEAVRVFCGRLGDSDSCGDALSCLGAGVCVDAVGIFGVAVCKGSCGEGGGKSDRLAGLSGESGRRGIVKSSK